MIRKMAGAPQSREWTLGEGLTGLVSVVIPAFNRADLIEETLDSVRAQTYRPIEIVVVDDGSTDATPAVVGQWAARYAEDALSVNLVSQPNQGASAARNQGVRCSLGEFIQFLDSDDLLGPTKITAQVDRLRQDPFLDFAYGPVAIMENPQRVLYGRSAMTAQRQLLKQIEMSTFTVMGPLSRRAMIAAIGPWDEDLTHIEDWEYFSRAAALGFVSGFAPEGACYYRMQGAGRQRLSSVDSPAKVAGYRQGRFRHLDSLWHYAIPRIKADPAFRRTLGWQWLQVTAEAVLMGWSGDDLARYDTAVSICDSQAVRALRRSVLAVRRVFGRRAAARYLRLYPWVYYRWHAVRLRLMAIERLLRSR